MDICRARTEAKEEMSAKMNNDQEKIEAMKMLVDTTQCGLEAKIADCQEVRTDAGVVQTTKFDFKELCSVVIGAKEL
jgi:hypothetical protein